MKSRILGPDEVFVHRHRNYEPSLIFVYQGEVQEFVHSHRNSSSFEDIHNLTIKKKVLSLSYKLILNPISFPFFYLPLQGSTLYTYEFFTHASQPTKSVKSVGPVEIHELRLSDFHEVLRKYPHEREVYAYLCDQLILNSRLSSVDIACSLCGESSHLETKCPYPFINCRSTSVIRRYNSFIHMTRSQIVRNKHRRKINALSEIISLRKHHKSLSSLSLEAENTSQQIFSSS